MAFINLVQWNEEKSSDIVYAWKYPETNLTTFTQLLVNESQEALLFSKGKLIGKFGPGKHTLNTENLPILHNLYGLPFGKKNPFTAEVWFVNKRIVLNIDWTISKMTIADPEFKFVPLVASGRYGLNIEDPSKFLIKLVGSLTSFTASQITDYFQGLIEQNTKSIIVTYMNMNHIRVTEINSKLTEIAYSLENSMKNIWTMYGLSLESFYVTNIEIDEKDPSGRSILDAIANASRQSIAGYTWQQEKAMEVANKAVGNTGDMGLLGMALFAGGFGGGAGIGQQLMTPAVQGYSVNSQGIPDSSSSVSDIRKQRRVVFCSSCGKKFSNDSKFCPNCGNPYRPCPVCGADNAENAKRCVGCGAQLSNNSMSDMARDAGLVCDSCGSPLEYGTRFCPHCGTKVK